MGSGLEKAANRQAWLGEIVRTPDRLSIAYGIDSLEFEASYRYGDVDLIGLEARFGRGFMEKVYFHIAAFELTKIVSLAPRTIDLGSYSKHRTQAFEALWRTVVRKVWAQWRYENGRPHYGVPRFKSQARSAPNGAAALGQGSNKVLLFSGGGKDSLVAAKLLERAEIPFSSYVYSHSMYGKHGFQHGLTDRLLDFCAARKRHRSRISDSLMDSPQSQLCSRYGTTGIHAGETPSSLFGVLPVLLEHGYGTVVLAHERSANQGNLVWDATGEAINHQWGKSLEAEDLLNGYIRRQLLSDFRYFSILQPLSDVLIFNLLRRDLEAAAHTHSCNIRKPWCMKCPKCVYVWLNCMAYLPADAARSIFQVNLFDLEENQPWLRQMLGLEGHKPFECIGEIDEARLAFELCRRKGVEGKAMALHSKLPGKGISKSVLDKYLSVDEANCRIPAAMAAPIFSQMRQAGVEAREYILGKLPPR